MEEEEDGAGGANGRVRKTEKHASLQLYSLREFYTHICLVLGVYRKNPPAKKKF